MGAPDVRLVPATHEHARELAGSLRAADAAEAEALGIPPHPGLEHSLAASMLAGTLLIDGHVGALYGLSPIAGPRSALGRRDVSCAWLMTSRLVDVYPLAFHRASKPVLREMLEHSRCLVNWVDARYTRSLEWLRVLGFIVGPPLPHGRRGLPFCFVSLGRF